MGGFKINLQESEPLNKTQLDDLHSPISPSKGFAVRMDKKKVIKQALGVMSPLNQSQNKSKFAPK